MIVQVIADEGTEAIFGYSGGAILPTYDAIFTFNEEQRRTGGQPVPLIVPANEQGAGFMAAGYARASGRVGVCLVTSGPGATNTVDTGARLHGRFGARSWSSAGRSPGRRSVPMPSRRRRWPSLMGSLAKHVFLVTDPRASKRPCGPRSRSRAPAARDRS